LALNRKTRPPGNTWRFFSATILKSLSVERIMENTPKENNQLGTASMWLGIASLALVFGIGLCALVGVQQGWIALLGTPLYVCGASSAFLGLVGAGLGIGGLFGKRRSKGTAIAGLLMGMAGICLFLFILSNVGG
jgi:hypothetical protein